MIRVKYSCGNDVIPKINMGRQGSNVWIGIKNTWKKLEDNTAQKIIVSGAIKWNLKWNGLFFVKLAYKLLAGE